MAYQFKLPDLGEGLTEGEIARWLVVEGDEVAEDQPLVEIQTDKTTVEIPSPAGGTVARILVAEGEDAEPGPPPASRVQVPGATQDRESPGRIQATPLVRRVAAELGVDLATVVPTGPAGRITEDDVRAAAPAAAAAASDERR